MLVLIKGLIFLMLFVLIFIQGLFFLRLILLFLLMLVLIRELFFLRLFVLFLLILVLIRELVFIMLFVLIFIQGLFFLFYWSTTQALVFAAPFFLLITPFLLSQTVKFVWTTQS